MTSQLHPLAPVPAESWTRADDKLYESLLVEFPEGCANRFAWVASRLPGKSVDEVVKRYEDLVADVEAIEEAGLIPQQKYGGDQRNRSHLLKAPTQRKNNPNCKWTEDEHKRFLVGLQELGKGDWRGISRSYVLTKTSSQVASHAQKYFMRHSKEGQKCKRRNSIHDAPLSSSEDGSFRNNLVQQLHEVQQQSAIIPHSQFTGPEYSLMDDVNYMQQLVGAAPESQLVHAAHYLPPQQLSLMMHQQQQPFTAIQSEHQDGDGIIQWQQQDGDTTDHDDQPFSSFDHLDENDLKEHEDLLADMFSDS